MRFITLAQILCLLAAVAAYPIQYVDSLPERSSGHLIQRDITPEIHERFFNHKQKEESSILSQLSNNPVQWAFDDNDDSNVPNLDKVKQGALEKAADYIYESNKKKFEFKSVVIKLTHDQANTWTAGVTVNGSNSKNMQFSVN